MDSRKKHEDESAYLLSMAEEFARYKMLKCDFIYNGNEVMCTGYGNTRKQAERNASIEGYMWLINNKVDCGDKWQEERKEGED